jgi:hypothetical protein
MIFLASCAYNELIDHLFFKAAKTICLEPFGSRKLLELLGCFMYVTLNDDSSV